MIKINNNSEWIKIDTIDNNIIDNLKNGCNLIKTQKKNYIIYKNKDGLLIAPNKCKHQGGKFLIDIEDSNLLKCSRHGWELNPKNMKYTNPCNKIQNTYTLKYENNNYNVYDLLPHKPWLPLREKQILKKNEFTLTYYSHACIKIKCGNKIIFTDPWLEGPAFMTGWWLLHEPPKNWLNDLSKANYIYISHSHSDHLNIPTLQSLALKNDNIEIIVGDLNVPVFNEYITNQTLMKNINPIKLGKWKVIDKNTRIMILRDELWEDLDTCMLLDYKGWLIFFNVDCNAPNTFHLPKVDIMLSDFARGASGFPSCHFGDKYTDKWKKKYNKRDKKKTLQKVKELINIVNCDIYIPYAGYFIEAENKYIQLHNEHNTADDVYKYIKKYYKYLSIWLPYPGRELDIFNKKIIHNNISKSKYLKNNWNIKKYKKDIDKYIYLNCFKTINGFKKYFEWANFKEYDMIQYIIETTNLNSDDIYNSFYIDYKNLHISKKKPLRKSKYYHEIKVDIGAFRKTLYYGLNWDNLYIGFQMRIKRQPDQYHKKFWDHFYTKLPKTPPNFDNINKDNCDILHNYIHYSFYILYLFVLFSLFKLYLY